MKHELDEKVLRKLEKLGPSTDWQIEVTISLLKVNEFTNGNGFYITDIGIHEDIMTLSDTPDSHAENLSGTFVCDYYDSQLRLSTELLFQAQISRKQNHFEIRCLEPPLPIATGYFPNLRTT